MTRTISEGEPHRDMTVAELKARVIGIGHDTSAEERAEIDAGFGEDRIDE
ncbi:hypothetical protein [Nocardia sp. NBC_01388]